MPVLDETPKEMEEQRRLQAIEADLVALKRAREAEREAVNRLPAPPRGSHDPGYSDFVAEMGERQERARLARVAQAQRLAEQRRLQAQKDAPKQAKRDQEVAALGSKLDQARELAKAAQANEEALHHELIALRNRPL